MKKSKRCNAGDRLSELPDSLIFHIFWLLPISDVVRTTKLSKRWRNLWTTSPFLNFSDDRNEGSLDSVRDFINRAIILWRGAKVLKFKVMFNLELTESLISDINVWLRFTKEKEVEELYLDLLRYPFPYDPRIVNKEFESLYSCSSLRVLSINHCPLFIGGNGNVKWDRLKSLTVNGFWEWDQDAITKILCGSPKLEVLFLTHTARGHNCCIQSGSLKKLSINCDDYYMRESEELKILTPNLETLEILGGMYCKLWVDVACLTDVTLGASCMSDIGACTEWCRDFHLDKKLEQIFSSAQHLRSVTLSDCYVEALGDAYIKSLLSPLSKVKFLKLIGLNNVKIFGAEQREKIVGLLQIFPKLNKLVIEDNYVDEAYTEDEDKDDYQENVQKQLEFEANFLNSFLLQLRTVEVKWAECDKSILSFIETLLKYANKLEKMVFRLQTPSHPSYPLFSTSQKLLRMPRSSPIAQLIFRDD